MRQDQGMDEISFSDTSQDEHPPALLEAIHHASQMLDQEESDAPSSKQASKQLNNGRATDNVNSETMKQVLSSPRPHSSSTNLCGSSYSYLMSPTKFSSPLRVFPAYPWTVQVPGDTEPLDLSINAKQINAYVMLQQQEARNNGGQLLHVRSTQGTQPYIVSIVPISEIDFLSIPQSTMSARVLETSRDSDSDTVYSTCPSTGGGSSWIYEPQLRDSQICSSTEPSSLPFRHDERTSGQVGGINSLISQSFPEDVKVSDFQECVLNTGLGHNSSALSSHNEQLRRDANWKSNSDSNVHNQTDKSLDAGNGRGNDTADRAEAILSEFRQSISLSPCMTTTPSVCNTSLEYNKCKTWYFCNCLKGIHTDGSFLVCTCRKLQTDLNKPENSSNESAVAEFSKEEAETAIISVANNHESSTKDGYSNYTRCKLILKETKHLSTAEEPEQKAKIEDKETKTPEIPLKADTYDISSEVDYDFSITPTPNAPRDTTSQWDFSDNSGIHERLSFSPPFSSYKNLETNSTDVFDADSVVDKNVDISNKPFLSPTPVDCSMTESETNTENCKHDLNSLSCSINRDASFESATSESESRSIQERRKHSPATQGSQENNINWKIKDSTFITDSKTFKIILTRDKTRPVEQSENNDSAQSDVSCEAVTELPSEHDSKGSQSSLESRQVEGSSLNESTVVHQSPVKLTDYTTSTCLSFPSTPELTIHRPHAQGRTPTLIWADLGRGSNRSSTPQAIRGGMDAKSGVTHPAQPSVVGSLRKNVLKKNLEKPQGSESVLNLGFSLHESEDSLPVISEPSGENIVCIDTNTYQDIPDKSSRKGLKQAIQGKRFKKSSLLRALKQQFLCASSNNASVLSSNATSSPLGLKSLVDKVKHKVRRREPLLQKGHKSRNGFLMCGAGSETLTLQSADAPLTSIKPKTETTLRTKEINPTFGKDKTVAHDTHVFSEVQEAHRPQPTATITRTVGTSTSYLESDESKNLGTLLPELHPSIINRNLNSKPNTNNIASICTYPSAESYFLLNNESKCHTNDSSQLPYHAKNGSTTYCLPGNDANMFKKPIDPRTYRLEQRQYSTSRSSGNDRHYRVSSTQRQQSRTDAKHNLGCHIDFCMVQRVGRITCEMLASFMSDPQMKSYRSRYEQEEHKHVLYHLCGKCNIRVRTSSRDSAVLTLIKKRSSRAPTEKDLQHLIRVSRRPRRDS